MMDEASSSRRSSSRSGESVVIDHGRRKSTCGYCRSTSFTSISHGLWAQSLTVDHYQELLDRGWRRSGCFLYKPDMEKTCCPSYTIRLKAGDFVPGKEQVRVHKKMQRYLDDTTNMKKADQFKEKSNSSKGLLDMGGKSFSASISPLSGKESSSNISAKMHLEDEFIYYLSNKIDEAINACVGSGEIVSAVQFPKAVVKKITHQAKRKLVEISEDLLYTSNISFQIAAVLRRSRSPEEKIAPVDSTNARRQEELDISPNRIAEKLACAMIQNGEPSGLIIKSCNGHLNFFSATRQTGSFLATDACVEMRKGKEDEFKQSCTAQNNELLPCKRRKLEIRMKQSSFDPEEFALYRKYQIRVHDDKPEKVTEVSYKRFLVDTPLLFVPPCTGVKTVPPCGYGSFHQQYLIDGKLVAVGVVDILPRCLSSKYLFWDPDYARLSLGKYSALQEINWVKEAEVQCPTLQYYYLGYYIHSCSKMRYKAAYHPSELLCPLRYEWVPFDIAKPLLDKKKYVILSDYTSLNNQAPSPQLPCSSNGGLGCLPGTNNLNKSFSDEDEESDDDHEGSDTYMDDESDSESSCVSLTNELTAADTGNIMISLNGSRVKFKDLQQVFGPIKKSHINELEMQLRRYVKAVGKELSNQMVYSLG